jgi:pantoate--beta-alanine ligase
MKIFKNKLNLQKEISKDNCLSFVPTMGGLHKGHLSLIKKAKRYKCKICVSIFVNPTQFNKRNDFKNYPRSLKSDIKELKKLKVNYLYLPTYADIYSFKTKRKIYIDKFSKQLCGKYRKGHFKGVLNVINRFLEIINPKYIFLGNKDLQQLILIDSHIKKK